MTDLQAAFADVGPPTVGLEEELMLLDAETFDLAPHAPEALALAGDDPRFKLELPAAQLEIVTQPHATVAEAARELAAARRDLAAAVAPRFKVAGAGAHPFASGVGVLNDGARYDAIRDEYAAVARRQLVFGLHVHVAIRPAERALAVYNALRSHLPELAAIAANAPYYEGADSGLASVRSRLSGLLPRQGVPPALPTLADYEAALAFYDDPRQWWWELRLHPVYGTLEIRVPDTQSTVKDTVAVAEAAHRLALELAARHDAGEPLPVAPSWRIDENRWSACRHGTAGTMADPMTGERARTAERIAAVFGAPLDAGGAQRQRAVATERGARGLTAWLADVFAPADRG